jgi:hypothetical protein
MEPGCQRLLKMSDARRRHRCHRRKKKVEKTPNALPQCVARFGLHKLLLAPAPNPQE